MAKLNKMWVVSIPIKDSELVDVFVQIDNLTDLMHFFRGVVHRNDIEGIYSSEADAKAMANRLLAAPSKRVSPRALKLWVVTKPTGHSEFNDIFVPIRSAEDMRLLFRGGLDADQIEGIYDNEAEAKKVATGLLNSQPGGPILHGVAGLESTGDRSFKFPSYGLPPLIDKQFPQFGRLREDGFTGANIPAFPMPLGGRVMRRWGRSVDLVPDGGVTAVDKETNSTGDWILRAISGAVSAKK
jgi:hypothetical protein